MSALSGRGGGAPIVKFLLLKVMAVLFTGSILGLGGEGISLPRRARECRSCHEKVLAGAHRIGMPPRNIRIPDGWPLDAEGRLSCETCHFRCGKLASFADPAAGKALRGSGGGERFCAHCHGKGRDTAGSRAVRQVLPGPKGPRGPEGPSPGSSAYQGPPEHRLLFSIVHPAAGSSSYSGIDETSQRCLACHDGTIAPSAESDSRPPPRIGEAHSSHPIGTVYPPRPKPTSEGAFVPLSGLDRRIVLVDGRVGCLSCHDIFGGEEHLLVMPNRESRLCYSCHDI